MFFLYIYSIEQKSTYFTGNFRNLLLALVDTSDATAIITAAMLIILLNCKAFNKQIKKKI
ncbi:MAG TPA: hypothetical protein VK882_07415 [Nitrososphaeraceae archaeon]|nr:hypothetical protein [Nitrososphaeraceae archaeon]